MRPDCRSRAVYVKYERARAASLAELLLAARGCRCPAPGTITVDQYRWCRDRIAAFDFRTLKDDRNFFPNHALCPVVRQDTLDANPGLKKPLNALSAKLDDATMRRLNKMLDVGKKSIENVARQFLTEGPDLTYRCGRGGCRPVPAPVRP